MTYATCKPVLRFSVAHFLLSTSISGRLASLGFVLTKEDLTKL